MIKEKWAAIIAGVAALVFVLKGFLENRNKKAKIKGLKTKLHKHVQKKKREAIKVAKKKHDDTVADDVSDWLDDELGPK